MPYYSITCFAQDTVSVPEAGQMLGPGLNVFTVVVDDIEALQERLEADGVTVNTVARLDDPTEAEDAARQLGEGSESSP